MKTFKHISNCVPRDKIIGRDFLARINSYTEEILELNIVNEIWNLTNSERFTLYQLRKKFRT